MITQHDLKKIFKYDKDTGEFKRLKKSISHRRVGTLSGCGYMKVGIKGKNYSLHRLAWLYVYGELPKKKLDHINHDRLDNRISNLREVDDFSNSRNQSIRYDNKSGHTGVYWYKSKNMWQVNIRVDYMKIHLGYFADKDDAIRARKEAEVKYGFHKNHGKRKERCITE